MPTVAETIVTALADHGVRTVWGVVGDALNPVTDAIRREERVEWIGVRHEEAGAFAAGAQAQLTGTIGVCMGTVGPGSIHLLNGLYDAHKSHPPVIAICGQVPVGEIGTDFFGAGPRRPSRPPTWYRGWRCSRCPARWGAATPRTPRRTSSPSACPSSRPPRRSTAPPRSSTRPPR